MAEGDGVWIQYDFGSAQPLKGVKLGFSSGNQRVYTFDVLVSTTGDDKSWVPVGDKLKSSGTTNEMELYPFKTVSARYVRIVGHGNTSKNFSKWCNVTEADFVTE